jgi:zinc finger protein
MCITDVPHFKEIILMCHLCEHCQYKSVEVKAGGGIAPLGKKIVLHVKKENKVR